MTIGDLTYRQLLLVWKAVCEKHEKGDEHRDDYHELIEKMGPLIIKAAEEQAARDKEI